MSSDGLANGYGVYGNGSDAGTSSNPWAIRDIEDLQAISPSNWGVDRYYRMTSDLDFTDVSWVIIGDSTNYFIGNFDGNGHSISNVTDSGNNYALFNITGNTTFKNVIFNTITKIAVLTGIERTRIIGIEGTTGSTYNFSKIAFENISLSNGRTMGCIVTNNSKDSINISNCYSYSPLISLTSSGGNPNYSSGSIGGIFSGQGNVGVITVTNCYSCFKQINSICGSAAGSSAGGIISACYSSGTTSSVSNCLSIVTSISNKRLYNSSCKQGRISGVASTTCSNNYTLSTTYATCSWTPTSSATGYDGQDITPTDISYTSPNPTVPSFWRETLGFDFDNIWHWDENATWTDKNNVTYYGLPRLRVDNPYGPYVYDGTKWVKANGVYSYNGSSWRA